MTGTCLYCGQTRIVEVNDQEDADMIATRECGACDNPVKQTYRLHRTLRSSAEIPQKDTACRSLTQI